MVLEILAKTVRQEKKITGIEIERKKESVITHKLFDPVHGRS